MARIRDESIVCLFAPWGGMTIIYNTRYDVKGVLPLKTVVAAVVVVLK